MILTENDLYHLF